MKKIKNIAKKILMTVLALTLLVGALPMGAMAAGDDIASEIRSIYEEAKERANVASFNGWCGSYVGHQLVVMGVNKDHVGGNGNQQYDLYANLAESSGGYRIRAFSADDYSLKQTLEMLTDNGTKNVYNILVGFHQGSGEAGRKYGHAVVINRIVGNTVYFSESFAVNMNGKRYEEGNAIACSINDFVSYYGSWTVYEGVIHFDTPSFDYRSSRNVNFMVTAAKRVDLRNVPGVESTYDFSQVTRTVEAGTMLHIVEVVENKVGKQHYWYKTSDGDFIWWKDTDLHWYTAVKCDITPVNTTKIKVTKSKTPLWNIPCSDATSSDAYQVKTLKKGTELKITAEVINSQGNLWLITSDGLYIFSGNTNYK